MTIDSDQQTKNGRRRTNPKNELRAQHQQSNLSFPQNTQKTTPYSSDTLTTTDFSQLIQPIEQAANHLQQLIQSTQQQCSQLNKTLTEQANHQAKMQRKITQLEATKKNADNTIKTLQIQLSQHKQDHQQWLVEKTTLEKQIQPHQPIPNTNKETEQRKEIRILRKSLHDLKLKYIEKTSSFDHLKNKFKKISG